MNFITISLFLQTLQFGVKMRRKETLKHSGVIQEITSEKITVKILNLSACAGCHVKSACSMADVKEKYVDVVNYGNQEWEIGEKVNVLCSEELGFIALFWAYVLPFIVVVSTLLICTSLNLGELYSGLISLGTLVPYYVTLSLFKAKLKKKFSFSIEKYKQI